MLLFAHTGITAGCAWFAGKTASLMTGNEPAANEASGELKNAGISGFQSKVRGTSRLPVIDYRMILIGSMLPDMIDKPLGIWLLADEIGSGRIYGHTLLFLLVIVASGTILYYFKRSSALLLIGAGTFAHLALDQMWQNPHTLFWPLLGVEFVRHDTGEWLGNLWEALTSNPSVYIPEIIGALIVAAFTWHIIKNRRLTAFIRTGKISR